MHGTRAAPKRSPSRYTPQIILRDNLIPNTQPMSSPKPRRKPLHNNTVAPPGECPWNNERILSAVPKKHVLRLPLSLTTPTNSPRQPYILPTSHRAISMFIPCRFLPQFDGWTDLNPIIVWWSLFGRVRCPPQYDCCGWCSDIHSIVKLSLQSLVTVLILLFTYSIVCRLLKPITSRLCRIHSPPVSLGGISFTVVSSLAVALFLFFSVHYEIVWGCLRIGILSNFNVYKSV